MQQLLAFIQRFQKCGELEKPVVNSLLYRLLGLGLIYGSQVALARFMGAKGYGDFTVILTAINFLLVISLFGFDTSVLRFVPSALIKGRPEDANGFIRFSYRAITVLAIVCSIGVFVFLLYKAKKFHTSFSEAVFWSMFLLPFLAFIYQASAVLRAFQRVKASLASVYFLLPVLLTLFCWYYYSEHKKLPVDAAIFIYLLCAVIVCLFISRRTSRFIKESIPSEASAYHYRLWTGVSGALVISTFLNMLLKQSDILFVSHFLDNTKAGIYAASAKMATLVALGLSVTDYVFVPRIAALWEKKRLVKIQELVRSASRQILMITLPVAIILILGGKQLLAMFGPTFETAYWPLVILVVGQLINAATGMVGGVLSMTGHQLHLLGFYVLAFVLQVFLNFILIPIFGITGAALSTALALIALNLSGYFFIRRRLKIQVSAF